jgi:hypothetical protein
MRDLFRYPFTTFVKCVFCPETADYYLNRAGNTDGRFSISVLIDEADLGKKGMGCFIAAVWTTVNLVRYISGRIGWVALVRGKRFELSRTRFEVEVGFDEGKHSSRENWLNQCNIGDT